MKWFKFPKGKIKNDLCSLKYEVQTLYSKVDTLVDALEGIKRIATMRKHEIIKYPNDLCFWRDAHMKREQHLDLERKRMRDLGYTFIYMYKNNDELWGMSE